MSKRKRQSPEQVARKLQKADRLLNAGESVAHVYQALGVSEATDHPGRVRKAAGMARKLVPKEPGTV